MDNQIKAAQSVDSIDGLIDKPDCTLEQLLDHDSFLEELRSSNEKLLSL